MKVGAFHFGPRPRAAAALLERDGRRRFWAKLAVDPAIDPRTRLRASQTLGKSEKDFDRHDPATGLLRGMLDLLSSEELQALQDGAPPLEVLFASWARLVRAERARQKAGGGHAPALAGPTPYEHWPPGPSHVIDGAASPPDGTSPTPEGA